MVLDFIEIGTSDFETIIQNTDNETGLSIDAVSLYLEKLPNKKNVQKINCAISNYSGEVDVFYVHPDDIEKNGLSWFLKGCNTIGKPHSVTLRELKEKNLEHLLQKDKVPVLTWKDLIIKYGITQVKLLKIDAEGHDIVIVKNILDESCDVLPQTIIFEANELTSDEDREEIINYAVENGYEFVDYNAKKDVILKLKQNQKILLINSWFGKIPDFYKYHQKTMQYQDENIDMYLFTDQDIDNDYNSKNYHIIKISEEEIKERFFIKTGKKYNDTLVGKTSVMKLIFLNNFFYDLIDYSKYDYVGIYDTDTLFNNIYQWVYKYLGQNDFISIGGGVNHDRLSGPFCIFKNTKTVMGIFESEEYLQNVLIENTNYLEHNIDKIAKSNSRYKIIQHSQNVDHETSKIFFEAEWCGGKVFCQNEEILVHHFYRKNETKFHELGEAILTKYRKQFETDFVWVTSFDQKYEKHVLSLIDTIEKYSNRKCLLFAINYKPSFRHSLSEQFIVRSINLPKGKIDSKGRDYNYLVCKPLVDLECLKILPESKFVHIDTDVLLTITCDDIINFLPKLENYPLFNSHTHDEFIVTGLDVEGGHVNPIRILADKTGDPVRVYPRRKTNIYLFDKNSKWFFEEQMSIFEKYYETVPYILYFHDEDTANILLNRHDYRNCLSLVDMEESDVLDLSKFQNYTYAKNPLSGSLVLPQKIDDLLLFHGIKDIDRQKKIIEDYSKTVLMYDDVVTYVKDDTIWFEKNSTLTDKKIESIVDFSIYKGETCLGYLNERPIFGFWYFFIGGINFEKGIYTCKIRETTSGRLIFKKTFKIT